MLKIIQTPKNPISKCTLSGKRWPEFEMFSLGIYFEYSDGLINFQFHYTQGLITILKGSWTDEYKTSDLEAFFDTQVPLFELWEWLDEIPFEILEDLPTDDENIRGIWKMTNLYPITKDFPHYISERYLVFQVSTATVRCYPYTWSDIIKFETTDEPNNLYWITICLLKYQRLSKQPSEE